jgi:hypothetical protein
MDRIEPEAFRFFCPLFADELVRREPLEAPEPSTEVIGGKEVVKLLSELGMGASGFEWTPAMHTGNYQGAEEYAGGRPR